MIKVSVVIVTKNRSQSLLHCLSTILYQVSKTDELVVIDNDSNDETKEIVRNFSKTVCFPIKYVLEKKHGYPQLYNRGLEEAKHQWVAFIDDDCVVDPKWLSAIKKVIIQKPTLAAFIGKTKTYYSNNLSSLACHLFDSMAKKNGREKTNIVDFSILDNRNIVYNNHFLKKHDLKFDESRTKKLNGAAEDCDLGMQIKTAGGKAKFIQEIKAWHKDPIFLKQLIKKMRFNFKSYYEFEQKWHINNQRFINSQKNSIRFRKYFFQFVHENKVSFLKSVALAIICSIIIIIKKYDSFIQKIK